MFANINYGEISFDTHNKITNQKNVFRIFFCKFDQKKLSSLQFEMRKWGKKLSKIDEENGEIEKTNLKSFHNN